jgi:hypothetical protein
MSAVCADQSSLTDDDLLINYTSGTVVGILPSTAPAASDRNSSNGMLTNTAIQAIVVSLKNAKIIPSPNPSNAEQYATLRKAFIENVKKEYCFYQARYKYSLTKLFSAVRSAYSQPTDANKTTVNRYLENSKMFNQKLNDLIQLAAAISADMLTISDQLQTELETMTTELKEQKTKLEEQNRIITTNDATTTIQKQMVKYTEEKANRTNNLLKLYSFLNVFALGMLVYIYKAAE